MVRSDSTVWPAHLSCVSNSLQNRWSLGGIKLELVGVLAVSRALGSLSGPGVKVAVPCQEVIPPASKIEAKHPNLLQELLPAFSLNIL